MGNSAPGFTLEDSEGNTYSLLDYKGKNPVIIYFYPKANTQAAQNKLAELEILSASLKKMILSYLELVLILKTSIKEFINDYNLNFPLLSDEKKEVSKAYGVLNTIGLDSRITFIIDKQGKIANILKDVDVETHADEVFNLAVKLK